MGIKYYYAVPVAHCPHSSAITIDGTAFGKNVYSGDCQPSDRLCEAGVGADLLIHEATFEIGMEDAMQNRERSQVKSLERSRELQSSGAGVDNKQNTGNV